MNITLFTDTELKKHIQQHAIINNYYETAAGTVWVQSTELGVFYAVFDSGEIPDQVRDDTKKPFTTSGRLPLILSLSKGQRPQKIILVGTDFQVSVWQAALQIPQGTTVTYHDIACAIGRPKAHRAVANALGDNKIVYFIPCHRVTKKDGKLGGYKYGVDKKLALLNAERS